MKSKKIITSMPLLGQIIILNMKYKKIGHFYAEIGKNHYFKQEIITLKLFLSQNKQK